MIKVCLMKAKHFYLLLNKSEQPKPTVSFMWEEKLQLPLDYDWKSVLDFKFKKVCDNKVRQFNFKLLHNILPFKDNLYKWKIAPDNICSTCKQFESSLHILLKCQRTTLFWQRISSVIRNWFKTEFLIEEKNIVTGYKISDPKFTLINLLLVYAQYAIYKAYILNQFKNKPFHSLFVWLIFKNDFRNYVKYKYKKDQDTLKDLDIYLC